MSFDPIYHPVIIGNLIANNLVGIDDYSCSPFIVNNTITNNTRGLYFSAYAFDRNAYPVGISSNNIYNNSYNVYVESSGTQKSIDLTNNWWGTTNPSTIAASIYDNADNPILAKVDYVPFLTEPNPTAPTISGLSPFPTPAPRPSPSPTATSSANPNPISTPRPTSTPTPKPTFGPMPTQISISVSATSTAVGSTVNVQGSLSDSNRKPLPNEQVIFSYAVANSNSWFQIGSGITDLNGEYNIQWVPSASGSFTLKAEWSGNANHLPANSRTTISLLPYQNQQVFLIESNSTVAGLNFNSTSFMLSFEVSGSQGTTGYIKAEIAKTLAPSFNGVTVSLDGKEVNFTVSSSNDYWIIAFTYHHSKHQVIVNLSADANRNPTPTAPVPEFPSWTILPMVLAAVTLLVAVGKKKEAANKNKG